VAGPWARGNARLVGIEKFLFMPDPLGGSPHCAGESHARAGAGTKNPTPSVNAMKTTTTDIKTTRSIWTRAVTLCAVLSAPMFGCDDPQNTDQDASEQFAEVDGLTLTMQDDRVAGSFTRGEATIDFVIERDGAVRIAHLSASDGSPLLDSVAEAGRETVTLLGGRATLSGDPVGEPEVEGDPTALDELRAMPEGLPIAELHLALEEAGVDPVLLGAEMADDEVAQRLYYESGYWNLGYGESLQVGTWGWITYTHIGVRNDHSGYRCVQFQAGAGGWADQCAWVGEETKRAYQFWGMLLTIKNSYNWGVTMKVRTW